MCRKLRDFSREEMFNIASEYANVPKIVRRDLAKKYNTNVDVISNVIQYCFKHRIVDSATAINIAKKAITNAAKHKAFGRTKKYYDSLLLTYYDIEIDSYIYPVNYYYTYTMSPVEKSHYELYLEDLKSKASSWDDHYISDDVDCPTKEQLLDEIEYLETILA